MPKLTWHNTGEKIYETGIDRGVLYLRDESGAYATGEAWNGLTSVTESPSGAEPTKQYADNRVYMTLVSVEEFGATLECYTYPESFGLCNGEAEPLDGVHVGQQKRETFGLAYRTLVGNDVDSNNHGYKIHLIYGALAGTSDKAYNTVNDSPEATTFSYELTTTPVEVEGLDPTALLTIDSTKTSSEALAALETALYGDDTEEARLPMPDEVISLMETAGGAGV